MGVNTDSEEAEVIWMVGVPERNIGIMWECSQALFGNDEKPFCYDREIQPYDYKDERIQSVYQEALVKTVTEMFGLAQLNRQSAKKVMLLTKYKVLALHDEPYPDSSCKDSENRACQNISRIMDPKIYTCNTNRTCPEKRWNL